MSSSDRHPRTRVFRSTFVLLGALLVGLPTGVLAAAPIAGAPAAGLPTTAFASAIVPGVHVGSVDLSGLDEATARQLLAQSYAFLGQGQVTVTADTASGAISYGSLGRRLDIDSIITQAFAVGGPTNIPPTVIFDEVSLAAQITTIANSSASGALNARAIRTTTGFSTVPGRTGHVYNIADLLPNLIAQLHDAGAPATIAVALTGVDGEPAITDEMAEAARAGASAMSLPIVLANAGDTWTIPQNVVHSWISFSVVNGTSIQILLNDALIQKALTALVPKINHAPVNASWAFAVKGVVVVPAKDGRALDVARTSRRIQVFLQSRATGSIGPDKPLGPTVNLTPAKLTTAQAQAQASKFKLLSTWTTYFQPASHNGFGANIWVPAGYLDNQVVQLGATFSFWDRVGPVTLARGYTLGGAIVGGHTEEGVAIGGGICSTSTTLFNAALRAGLKIGERSNHYYYITRYPVGLDATVSKTSGGGEQDMTFTNDTPYPILVKSFKTSGSVSFSLYGIPTGRTVTFSKPVITNYQPATSQIIHVSTLPTGRLVRIEYPDDGFNSSVTAFVRDAHGKLISNRTYVSHYGMVVGVQYLGDPAGQNIAVPSYAPGAQGG